MPRLASQVPPARRPDDADFASTDEVIVYEDEGDAEDAKSGLVENLTEEKLGLLTETEQTKSPHNHADLDYSVLFGKRWFENGEARWSDYSPFVDGRLAFNPFFGTYPYHSANTLPAGLAGFGSFLPSAKCLEYVYGSGRHAQSLQQPSTHHPPPPLPTPPTDWH